MDFYSDKSYNKAKSKNNKPEKSPKPLLMWLWLSTDIWLVKSGSKWPHDLNLAHASANLTSTDLVSVTSYHSKPVNVQKFHAHKLI